MNTATSGPKVGFARRLLKEKKNGTRNREVV